MLYNLSSKTGKSASSQSIVPIFITALIAADVAQFPVGAVFQKSFHQYRQAIENAQFWSGCPLEFFLANRCVDHKGRVNIIHHPPAFITFSPQCGFKAVL